MVWIKAFYGRSMHSSVGNASLGQFMQEWHSLRFYIAGIGSDCHVMFICILKLGRELSVWAAKTSQEWTTFHLLITRLFYFPE